MNSVWLSLLWKEWCEFRWKLVALTLSFIVGLTILTRIFADDHWQDVSDRIIPSLTACLIVYAILAGAFVGASVAAGENSQRTMRFTQALPIPMWLAGIVRILVGLFTVLVPILCVMFLTWAVMSYLGYDQPGKDLGVVRGTWQFSSFYINWAVSGMLGVASLMIWASVCGVNFSDEVRAGAVAFLVCAVLWGVFIYGMVENIFGLRPVLAILTAILPGGAAFAGDFNDGLPLISKAFIFSFVATSHTLLLLLFVTMYGRVAGRSYSVGKQFITDWFRFRGPAGPFRSSSMAIMWKQVRELGPLALMSATGVLAVMALTYLSDNSQGWTNYDWSNLLGGLTLMVGGFVTLVSGIGMIYEDYSRGLPNFWRSRPINLHQWFLLKYITGIMILVVAFGPLLWFADKLSNRHLIERNDDVAGLILFFLGLYSGSLAAFALVRQPIYAVILAISALLGCIILVPATEWLWRPHNIYHDNMMLYVSIVAVILSTILAWQAVVRDWGWKRHR